MFQKSPAAGPNVHIDILTQRRHHRTQPIKKKIAKQPQHGPATGAARRRMKDARALRAQPATTTTAAPHKAPPASASARKKFPLRPQPAGRPRSSSRKSQGTKAETGFPSWAKQRKRTRKGQKPHTCPRRCTRAVMFCPRAAYSAAPQPANSGSCTAQPSKHIPRQRAKHIQCAQKPWEQWKKHDTQVLFIHRLVPLILITVPCKTDIVRRVNAAEELAQCTFQARRRGFGAQRTASLPPAPALQTAKTPAPPANSPARGRAARRKGGRRAHQLYCTGKSARSNSPRAQKRAPTSPTKATAPSPFYFLCSAFYYASAAATCVNSISYNSFVSSSVRPLNTSTPSVESTFTHTEASARV